MGQFRLEVQAVGNHGCERDKGDGEHVVGCEKPGCVDCACRELVRRLKRSGALFSDASGVDSYATITHWPGQQSEVKDDLLSGVRTGSF